MKNTKLTDVLDLNEMSMLMDMLVDLHDLTPKQKEVKGKIRAAYQQAVQENHQ